MDPTPFGGLPATPRELQAQNEVMKRLAAENPEPVTPELMRDEDFRKSMNDLMDYLMGLGTEVIEVGDLAEEDGETASDPGWEDRVYSDGFQVPDEDGPL